MKTKEIEKKIIAFFNKESAVALVIGDRKASEGLLALKDRLLAFISL